jgi:hypothetical protein
MGLLKKLLGREEPQVPTMQEFENIVSAYGDTMGRQAPEPGCVADVNRLPFPKPMIKHAISVCLKSTTDKQRIDALKTGYLLLADWQEGVSETGQEINTLYDRLRKELFDKETAALAQELAEFGFPVKTDWPSKLVRLAATLPVTDTMIENTKKVISYYRHVLQNEAPDTASIADITALTLPKDIIKGAIITHLRTSEEEAFKSGIRRAYLELAYWQEGVGNKHLNISLAGIAKDINEEFTGERLSDKEREWQLKVKEEIRLNYSELDLFGLGYNS